MSTENETPAPADRESLAGPPDPAEAMALAATVLGGPSAGIAAAGGQNQQARFTRLRLHATGGMGRVWLARDERLRREVALKELRPELVSRQEVEQRFLAEARITGRLEHPGIVPIYELVRDGASDAYAMRFLRGRTLTEAIKAYHEKKRVAPAILERAALLQVFVTVCETVAFAHARGVWHRDLKGQNVLLGDFGEVIVLDWGLAKEASRAAVPEPADDASRLNDAVASSRAAGPDPPATQADLPESAVTLAGQIIGTPYYMSPEQAAGETARIDQRSDIYSLGAILYEILTGQVPFTDQTTLSGEKSMEALLRRIRHEPPTRPRQLAPDAPVPLQAVCLRALAKDPADRYQSATELAQEVRRWLADEPVRAHKDAWNVRLGRWARRHRTMVASLGVFLSAIIVGLVVTTLLINHEKSRTEQARAKAVRNFRKAQEAVDRYFMQVSEVRLLDEPGMLPLRQELLASARDFYEDFAREHKNDVNSRRALGEARLKLARITRAMGDRAASLKMLEDAQGLFKELAAEHPEDESYELSLAQSYVEHGFHSSRLHGRSPEAEAELEKARSILKALVARNRSRANRTELGHVLNYIVAYHDAFYQIDDKAEAVKIAQKSEQAALAVAALWKELADEEPDVPVRLKDLAGAYNNLANLYGNLRDQDKRKTYLDKALDLRLRLVKQNPHSMDFQENLAASYNNIGTYYTDTQKLAEAEKMLRESASIREKLVKENCQVVQFQQGLAKVYFNLGNLCYQQVPAAAGAKRATLFAKSKVAYDRALDLYRRLYEESPEEPLRLLNYGVTLSCLGDLLSEDKQALAIPWYDQAISRLEEAVRHGEKAAEARRPLRNSYWGRAEARMTLGQYAQAVADWDRALELDDGTHKKEWEAKRAQALKMQKK
jgi:serine/threonine-protein kinase